MDDHDPLWLPEDQPSIEGEVLAPIGHMSSRSGKWSRAMADQFLEIVGECGSPTIAAKRVGVTVKTIDYHRKKDQEFGAAYDQAIRGAVEALVTNSIARAGDISDPSNEALTLAWLRLRGDRVNAWLDGETATQTDGLGLDYRVVSLMTSEDRRALLSLLNKYMEASRALAITK
jgi:hypothetical protein